MKKLLNKNLFFVSLLVILLVILISTAVHASTTVGLNIVTGGTLSMNGSTSGTVTIQPQTIAGTWNLSLPTDDGTNGQVLTTNGSGVTSWTTVVGGGGISNSAGANVIPKSDGVNLVASQISDDGNLILLGQGDTAISINNANDVVGLFTTGPNIQLLGTNQTISANASTTIDINHDNAGNVRLGGGGDSGINILQSAAELDLNAATEIKINSPLISLIDSAPVLNARDGNLTLSADDSIIVSSGNGELIPTSAGGIILGNSEYPFQTLFIGMSANNSSEIRGVFTGNRRATLPDETGIIQVSNVTAFASLPACNSTNEGMVRGVNNSNTNTWGTTIAGGGANHVLAYCNGTSWTVTGK